MPTRLAIAPAAEGRCVERGDRLGRHRWVVERTPACFRRFRRPVVRHGRRADLHLALLTLAAVLITFRFVQRWFARLSHTAERTN